MTGPASQAVFAAKYSARNAKYFRNSFPAFRLTRAIGFVLRFSGVRFSGFLGLGPAGSRTSHFSKLFIAGASP